MSGDRLNNILFMFAVWVERVWTVGLDSILRRKGSPVRAVVIKPVNIRPKYTLDEEYTSPCKYNNMKMLNKALII